MVFNYNTFISNVTFADYERLQKTKDYAQREALVKKAPYVLLLILKSWNDNDEELKKLIKTGIMYCDDFNLLSALKERDGFKVLPEYVNASVYANPEFIFDLTEEEKNLVSRNALIDAFVRDCRILSSGCPALNKRSELITFKKMEDGVEVTKYRHCTLRSQLLTAIRIATGVYSPSDKGYDDFAMKIAKRLITIQQAEKFENMTNIQELMNEVPTVMNGLIKKQHQMVRLCKGKALRLNNFKCLHAMIKEEAKDNSKLKGLHNDIPKSAVPEKTFENAIAKGIKTNYKFSVLSVIFPIGSKTTGSILTTCFFFSFLV